MEMQEINNITIKGLFYQYDVDIDFSKDCTILIGPNGVGKSTVIKLVKYLLSGMLMEIATVPFHSIVVDECEMLHEDFLIPTDALLKYFNELVQNNIENSAMAGAFENMVFELKTRNMLGDFLCELYYSERFSYSITGVVEKYLSPELVHKMQVPVFECADSNISAYSDIPVLKSNFVQNLIGKKYWHRDVFYFDMVQKVEFPSYKETTSGVYSKVITEDWHAFDADGNLSEYLVNASATDQDVQQFVEQLKKYPITYKYGYSSRDIDGNDYLDTTDISQEFMIGLTRLITKKSIFDINGFINLLYYDPDLVAEINMQMVEFIENYYKNRDELRSGAVVVDVGTLRAEFDDRMIGIHNQYIRPILAKHSVFDVNLERILRKVTTEPPEDVVCEMALLLAYKAFYYDIYDDIISEDNMSQNIRALKDLLMQYLTEYNIAITPKGIALYMQRENDGIAINEDVVIFSDQNELSLDKLSSGESKIIALCFLAQCSDYAILILDEPELSISIIWQEKLLVDLMDYGTFASIVVATHSPYIARDESLAKYISYLP